MKYHQRQEEIRKGQRARRINAVMRSLATCIESYYVDLNAYPAAASGALGVNNLPGATSETLAVSTFRAKLGPDDPMYTLTTPISYCTSYFADPFSSTKRATFAYARGPNSPASWILWSPGPDRDYDIDMESDYDPAVQNHPSPSLIRHTYDPTNGTKSDGDIWRAKQ